MKAAIKGRFPTLRLRAEAVANARAGVATTTTRCRDGALLIELTPRDAPSITQRGAQVFERMYRGDKGRPTRRFFLVTRDGRPTYVRTHEPGEFKGWLPERSYRQTRNEVLALGARQMTVTFDGASRRVHRRHGVEVIGADERWRRTMLAYAFPGVYVAWLIAARLWRG